MKRLISVLLVATLLIILPNTHAAAQSYNVTIAVYNLKSNGTATANPQAAQPGQTVTLTAEPADTHVFYYWDVESGDIDIDDIYSPVATFEMPASNVRIRPVFTRKTPEPTPTAPPAIPNKHSEWAEAELQRAVALNLIPASLQDANVDYTMPVSRLEFAGIVARTYENLAETIILPAAHNPFKDTQDVDALRALSAGLMVGVSANEFAPNIIPSREQAATALARVFKKYNMPGWSLENDAYYTLEFDYPGAFADDDKISDWAYESVYFMAANGIIQGVGNNLFAPRATTSAEEALEYAATTREEAIILALRTIENLR